MKPLISDITRSHLYTVQQHIFLISFQSQTSYICDELQATACTYRHYCTNYRMISKWLKPWASIIYYHLLEMLLWQKSTEMFSFVMLLSQVSGFGKKIKKGAASRVKDLGKLGNKPLCPQNLRHTPCVWMLKYLRE